MSLFNLEISELWTEEQHRVESLRMSVFIATGETSWALATEKYGLNGDIGHSKHAPEQIHCAVQSLTVSHFESQCFKLTPKGEGISRLRSFEII
jgi:hypothetical protein